MTKAGFFSALGLITAVSCGPVKEPPAPAHAEVVTSRAPRAVSSQVVEARSVSTLDVAASRLDRSCDTDDECVVFTFDRACEGLGGQSLAISERGRKSLIDPQKGAPGLCSKGSVARAPTAKTAVCERHICELTDSAALFEWAKKAAPGIASLRAVRHLADVPWVMREERLSLHVDSAWRGDDQNRRCVAIEFERQDATLRGEVDISVDSNGTRCAALLDLSDELTLYERTCKERNGNSQGYGGFSRPGGSLSPDTEGALSYTTGWFTALPDCRKERLEQPHCAPKVCERCAGVDVKKIPRPGSMWGSSLARRPAIQAGPDAPCDACAPDEITPLLPRLRAAVRGREFVSDGHTGPTFYRQKKDCESALRAALQHKKK